MGLAIFEASGTFSPADYGLIAGNVIDVICVGGGGSGAYSYYKTYGGPGDPEGEMYIESVAGSESSVSAVSSANGTVMAKGETASVENHVGGGAGGYLPGISFYGGNGGSGVGLASARDNVQSPYCNPGGRGNKGASGGFYSQSSPPFGAGGNGYGAGGGGKYQHSRNDAQPAEGGDAGKIAYGSIILQGTADIAVTVGSGGVNTALNEMRGADGVVLIFW